jgi:hypothetical protein
VSKNKYRAADERPITDLKLPAKPADPSPLPTSKSIPIVFGESMDKIKLPTTIWIWGGYFTTSSVYKYKMF